MENFVLFKRFVHVGANSQNFKEGSDPKPKYSSHYQAYYKEKLRNNKKSRETTRISQKNANFVIGSKNAILVK